MFLRLSPAILRGSKNRKREQGNAGLFLCVLIGIIGMLTPLVFIALDGALTHARFVEAYLQGFQREYEVEGVLTEAVVLLEGKGRGYTTTNANSSFSPSYTFTITSDTITLTKNGRAVLKAKIGWEGEEVVVLSAENDFVKPFTQ
ncbi:MAG: hypothetical protein ACUVTO_04055 [Candidatus Caldatribacteriaceae bacterium]